MADNVGFTPGAGALIAADEIAGVLHQRIKMQFGADGSATDVSSADPMPVDVPGVSTEATLSALKASVDTLSAKVSACNTDAVALDAATLAALETVTISNPTAQGLTDAQLRDTPVPVSGDFYQATQPISAAALPLPTGAATEATAVLTIKQKNSASAVGDYGQVIFAQRRDADTAETTADGQYTALKQDEAGRLKVATQPASNLAVSGSITANAQNVSILCGRFGNLSVSMVAASLVGHNISFECSNNSTNGTDGAWYGVQAVRSNANTCETASGVLTATPAYMWHVNVGDYLYFRVRATAHTSGTAAYILKPGSYATEPIPAVQITGTQPVSGTVTATNTTPTPLNTSSAATTNPVLVKGSAGTLFSIAASNIGAAAAYLKLYNKATAPTVGTDIPVLTIQIPASGVQQFDFGTLGHRFATGIGFSITGAAADNDTTAIAAAQVKVLTSYV